MGSFINTHEIKIGLPTFAPFFHHFFLINKIFLSETKSSGKGQSCFSFLLFFLQMCGWLHCATIFLHTKKELYKKRHIFFILLSLFLGFKNEISFHIFHILFFLLSIYPLAKWYVIHSFHLLNCDAIGRVDEVRIFFIQLMLGRVKKIVL